MPLYEYRCKECGEEFEKQLRFAEADQLPACPRCSSTRTQKKLSRVIALSFAAHGESGAGSISGAACGSGGAFT